MAGPTCQPVDDRGRPRNLGKAEARKELFILPKLTYLAPHRRNFILDKTTTTTTTTKTMNAPR
jgi:hypothetical protein